MDVGSSVLSFLLVATQQKHLIFHLFFYSWMLSTPDEVTFCVLFFNFFINLKKTINIFRNILILFHIIWSRKNIFYFFIENQRHTHTQDLYLILLPDSKTFSFTSTTTTFIFYFITNITANTIIHIVKNYALLNRILIQ